MEGSCSVEGCDSPAKKAGLCGKHYLRRWRHGDTSTVKKAANGDGLRFIEEVALHHGTDECLIWPFRRGVNGYASVTIGRRAFGAHRLVCEMAHGAADNAALEAAHRCGNGHLGCVNPHHLRWATHAQNMLDKQDHGTQTRGGSHPVGKLSEADIKAIRDLRGRKTQREIAVMYSISPGHVCSIQTGKAWGWL